MTWTDVEAMRLRMAKISWVYTVGLASYAVQASVRNDVGRSIVSEMQSVLEGSLVLLWM